MRTWEPAFVTFLGGEVEGWTPQAVAPPRERAHTGEARGLPPSLLHGPQAASETALGVQHPAIRGTSLACRVRGCRPWASPWASPWAQFTVCAGLREMDGLSVLALPTRWLRGSAGLG